MKFSQRIGISPIEPIIQIEEISSDLRTTLWNIFYTTFFKHYETVSTRTPYYEAIKIIWFQFLKYPLDNIGQLMPSQIKMAFKELFFEKDWFLVYEFYEYLLNGNFGSISIDSEQLSKTINYHLKKENSGYRLIENEFVPIINETEIAGLNRLNESTQSEKLSTINNHLKSAISLLSNKSKPDYRNSIKESISMVESISRIISPKEKTLGKALKKLKDKDLISQTLIEGFEKLYGYTNGKDGIRHSILNSANEITREDAQYFLISCSAFVNYLLEKGRTNDLIE